MKDYFDLSLKDLEINDFKITDLILVPSKFYRQVAAITLNKQ